MPDRNIALRDALSQLGPSLAPIASRCGRKSPEYRAAVRAACDVDDLLHALKERQPVGAGISK
jgi:hypothetical protein